MHEFAPSAAYAERHRRGLAALELEIVEPTGQWICGGCGLPSPEGGHGGPCTVPVLLAFKVEEGIC